MALLLGIGILVGATEYFLLSAGRRDEGWNISLNKQEKALLTLVDILTCIILIMLYPNTEGSRAEIGLALLCVFQGCLLTACVMDLKEKMVYRYVWLASGLAAVGLLFYRVYRGIVKMGFGEMALGYGNVSFVVVSFAVDLMEYILFVMLQQFLFSKMYGRADCHAFCACGAVMLALGGGFDDDVMHMAVAFVLLLIVQVCRGNVTWKGKLKEPTPMLPYITAGFWLWVDFHLQRWYI